MPPSRVGVTAQSSLVFARASHGHGGHAARRRSAAAGVPVQHAEGRLELYPRRRRKQCARAPHRGLHPKTLEDCARRRYGGERVRVAPRAGRAAMDGGSARSMGGGVAGTAGTHVGKRPPACTTASWRGCRLATCSAPLAARRQWPHQALRCRRGSGAGCCCYSPRPARRWSS